MLTYEESINTWSNLLEEIEHPTHKNILSNFSTDMVQEVVYHLEEGTFKKDFNSIMNYALEYIVFSLSVQVKHSSEFDMLETVFGKLASDEVDNAFMGKCSKFEIKCDIEDFMNLEEIQEENLEADEVDGYPVIHVNFNEKQLALLKITNKMAEIGNLVCEYLDITDTIINGEHFDSYEY